MTAAAVHQPLIPGKNNSTLALAALRDFLLEFLMKRGHVFI